MRGLLGEGLIGTEGCSSTYSGGFGSQYIRNSSPAQTFVLPVSNWTADMVVPLKGLGFRV